MNYDVLVSRSSPSTVKDGMEVEFSGGVQVISFLHQAIHATVKNKDQKEGYSVNIEFDNEDCTAVRSAVCGCKDHRVGGKDCIHIVAGAITAQRLAKKGAQVVPAEEAEPPDEDEDAAVDEDDEDYDLIEVDEDFDIGTSEDDFPSFAEWEREERAREIADLYDEEAEENAVTDEFVISVLVHAEIIRTNRLSKESNQDEQALLFLEPVLNVKGYEGTYLTLKIGYKKMYLVKDVVDFINRYSLGETLELGKKDEVRLYREAFHPESLPLLDFVIRHYRYPHHERYNSSRRIDFTNSVMDEFLMLFGEGDQIRIEADRYDKIGGVYTVREKDYPLHFTLKRQNNMACLRSSESFEILPGRALLYLLIGNNIYKCSPEYSNRCGFFIRRMASMGRRIELARKDLPNLYTSIIYETEDFLHFEIDEIYMDEQPEPLVTKVWFDVREKGGVQAKMMFYYGEKEHPAFGPKYLNVTLDLAGESMAESILHKYMGNESPEPGLLVLLEEEKTYEEFLYKLVTYGIPRLTEVAEIYASEDFKRIKVRPKSVLNIGVAIREGLLEIDFDPEDIDYEDLANVLTLEDGAIADLDEITDGLDISEQDLKNGTIRVGVNRAPYIDYLLKRSEGIRYERDDNFKNIIRNLRDVSEAEFHLPGDLNRILRNYQKTGFRWLKTLDFLHFGGILADDMGLGKTLQVLSLLSHHQEESLGEGPADSAMGPSLVVCPASVVLNWEAESQRFTPALKTAAMVGGKKERDDIIRNAAAYDLIITSYGQLVRDVGTWGEQKFRYVVLDEAQFIKNQNTQSAKAVKLLNGATRLALTGTPVENNLAELWSVFDFIMPGYLGRYPHFRGKYETRITKSNDAQATERLRTLVRPFILRRLKKDVLKELPEKTESVVFTRMEGDQQKLYLAMLAQTKKELAVRLAEVTDGQGHMVILAALTRLRQICCDPALLYENYKGKSAKLEACMELIRSSVESGHRMLLFSQFTSMMAILREALVREKIPFCYLDGSTPKHERMTLVNSFNGGDTPIFLISLKAGGTGLNLTGADVVIHYDPWWNVSVENQATDRAHRIGQEKNVQVFKLIMKGSIEEKILKLQEKKAALADAIIQAGGNAFETLTKNELLALFEEE